MGTGEGGLGTVEVAEVSDARGSALCSRRACFVALGAAGEADTFSLHERVVAPLQPCVARLKVVEVAS